ncbi:Protein sidekick-1 [Saguinus oedipus]|uniref:Protein sidekick-1 n=1 Tax=Saguinus oedipus TaxID=9490 RepID=A0ABQ9W8A7_SAGOE|nr:Protein sidekick-1 [Saguinus oedipus]
MASRPARSGSGLQWPRPALPSHRLSPAPQATDSDYEEALPKHSFVNHYMSDPTYYNSWKRRAQGRAPVPHRYEAVAGAEAGAQLHPVITTQSAGGVYTPAGPGARTPLTGFSSFV